MRRSSSGLTPTAVFVAVLASSVPSHASSAQAPPRRLDLQPRNAGPCTPDQHSFVFTMYTDAHSVDDNAFQLSHASYGVGQETGNSGTYIDSEKLGAGAVGHAAVLRHTVCADTSAAIPHPDNNDGALSNGVAAWVGAVGGGVASCYDLELRDTNGDGLTSPHSGRGGLAGGVTLALDGHTVIEHRGKACLSEDEKEWNDCAVDHGFEYCGVRVCTSGGGGRGRGPGSGLATLSSLGGSECAVTQPQCTPGSAVKTSSSFVRMDVNTDAFAEETSWEVRRSTPNDPTHGAWAAEQDLLLAGGDPVYLGNDVLLGRAGVGVPLQDNDSYESTACLPDDEAADACFDLRAVDAYGDGMGCGADGKLALTLETLDRSGEVNRVTIQQRDQDMAKVAQVQGTERLACLNEKRLQKWSYCAVRVCANGDVTKLDGNQCDFGLGDKLLDEKDAGNTTVLDLKPQKAGASGVDAVDDEEDVVVITPQKWGMEESADSEDVDVVTITPQEFTKPDKKGQKGPRPDSPKRDEAVTIQPQKSGAADSEDEGEKKKIKPHKSGGRDEDSGWNFNLNFQWDIINGDKEEESPDVKPNKSDVEVEVEVESHPDWDLNVNDLQLNVIHDDEGKATTMQLNNEDFEEAGDREKEEEGVSLVMPEAPPDLIVNIDLQLNLLGANDGGEVMQENTTDLAHDTWAEYYEWLQPGFRDEEGSGTMFSYSSPMLDLDGPGEKQPRFDMFVPVAPTRDRPRRRPRDAPASETGLALEGPRPQNQREPDKGPDQELVLTLRPFSATLLDVRYPKPLKNRRRPRALSRDIAAYLMSYFGHGQGSVPAPTRVDLDCTTAAEAIGPESRWVVTCTGTARFPPDPSRPSKRDVHAVITSALRGTAKEAFLETMYGKESQQQEQLLRRFEKRKAKKRREKQGTIGNTDLSKRGQKKKEKREAQKQTKQEQLRLAGTVNVADVLGDSNSDGISKRDQKKKEKQEKRDQKKQTKLDKQQQRSELNVMGYVSGAQYMNPMSGGDKGYKLINEGEVHVYVDDDERGRRRHLRHDRQDEDRRQKRAGFREAWISGHGSERN